MISHSLSVDLFQALLAMSHASICPLYSHWSHRWFSFSEISQPHFLLQVAQLAFWVCPLMLLQKGLHLILPNSRHLMWSFRRCGTPRAFTPFSSLSFVGQRPVISSILSFAVSRVSWHGIGFTFLEYHFSRALYMCLASSVWSLAPSCR